MVAFEAIGDLQGARDGALAVELAKRALDPKMAPFLVVLPSVRRIEGGGGEVRGEYVVVWKEHVEGVPIGEIPEKTMRFRLARGASAIQIQDERFSLEGGGTFLVDARPLPSKRGLSIGATGMSSRSIAHKTPTAGIRRQGLPWDPREAALVDYAALISICLGFAVSTFGTITSSTPFL